MAVYTYLVSFLLREPTGGFFSSWEWTPDWMVFETTEPVTEAVGLNALTGRIADSLSTEYDGKYGRGITRQHFVFKLFIPRDALVSNIRITNLVMLTHRPS